MYANRRRVKGGHGKQLLKQRGELWERYFAHRYETGGMRRTHLRGHENILKRVLIHVCAFNLSLIFRKELGAGTPRELRNRAAGPNSAFIALQIVIMTLVQAAGGSESVSGCSGSPSEAGSLGHAWKHRSRDLGGVHHGLLGPYPVTAEFRAILATFVHKARPPQYWDGERAGEGNRVLVPRLRKQDNVRLFRRGVESSVGTVPAGLGYAGSPRRLGRPEPGIRGPVMFRLELTAVRDGSVFASHRAH